MAKKRKKRRYKTKYAVLKKWHSGQKAMFTTYDYKKALKFYHKHPRAFGIQKYRGGVTAGLIQPDVPHKIRIKGKTYRRPYVGPHTKKTAQALASDFKRDKKHFKDVKVKKSKRGYQLYLLWK